jgi:hypothetical protein
VRARRRSHAALALLGACTVLVGACSDDTPADPAVPSTAASSTAASSTSTTVAIVGDPLNQFTLVLGDCFNRYDVGATNVTTKLPCDEPHQREVYATATHPARFGEPWPGDDALQQYGLRLCYQNFQAFVGVIYELSELGIGVLTPPQENWDDERARYRGITCYLTRNDGKPLVGSMRGKAV